VPVAIYSRLRLLLISSLIIASLIWLNSFLLDGLEGTSNSLLLGEDTYYSAGYSDSAFRKVKIGMTKDQVRALLGEPLSEYPIVEGGREGWRYSWKRTDTHYRARVVIFKDGRVVKVRAHFYVD
jgi:hypothetical protein